MLRALHRLLPSVRHARPSTECDLWIREKLVLDGKLACENPSVMNLEMAVLSRYMSSKPEESVEAFDARWEAYFDRKDIDNWELRKGVNELYGHDLVPEPRIVNAMLRACRQLDDYAMAVRVLEMVKLKCAESGDKEIYPYIIQNCKPTMDELGVNSVEDLGLGN